MSTTVIIVGLLIISAAVLRAGGDAPAQNWDRAVVGVSKAAGLAGSDAARDDIIVGIILVVFIAISIANISVVAVGVILVGVVTVGVVVAPVILIIFHGGHDCLVNLIRGLFDYQTPCAGLNMDRKGTEREYLPLPGN